ncbi:1-acyl-sn-glycerol-3-phosphate acyltransferase [Algimonas porphyrae]|uniref:1-acyl-sn-glycerol-3-phosphate acyltransferase n=1 Tax=Algimonas porphyrae TaxID=1128113 RepID=UPI00352AAB06
MSSDPTPVTTIDGATDYPRQGNGLTRWIGLTLLKLMGWRIKGEWPDVPKLVTIGAPHTSNWDLGLAMGMMLGWNLRLSWMMKKEAFVWPLGWLWKKMGGIPIDRKAAQDIVEQTADAFARRDKLHLGITPEGTRSKVGGFRKGYLRIAYAANVPVFLVGVDAPNRQVVLDKFWPLTGDIDADNAAIETYYRDTYQGIHAAKS